MCPVCNSKKSDNIVDTEDLPISVQQHIHDLEQSNIALQSRVEELDARLEDALLFGLPQGQISREFDGVRKMRVWMFTRYRGENVCTADSLDALFSMLHELGLWGRGVNTNQDEHVEIVYHVGFSDLLEAMMDVAVLESEWLSYAAVVAAVTERFRAMDAEREREENERT